MKKQTIINIVELLKRTRLTGEEVQAYNEATIELNELLIIEIEKEKAISEKKDE